MNEAQRKELIEITLRAAKRLEEKRSQQKQGIESNVNLPCFKINQNLKPRSYKPTSKDVPEDPSKDSTTGEE